MLQKYNIYFPGAAQKFSGVPAEIILGDLIFGK